MELCGVHPSRQVSCGSNALSIVAPAFAVAAVVVVVVVVAAVVVVVVVVVALVLLLPVRISRSTWPNHDKAHFDRTH